MRWYKHLNTSALNLISEANFLSFRPITIYPYDHFGPYYNNILLTLILSRLYLHPSIQNRKSEDQGVIPVPDSPIMNNIS